MVFVPNLSGPGAYIIMLITQKVIGGILLTSFFPGQSYRGVCTYIRSGAYITMLFIQMLSKYVFNNFFSRVKIIMVFVLKLSSPSIYYHVIYQESIFSTIISCVKVIVVFVPKLSGLQCIYYHAIYK